LSIFARLFCGKGILSIYFHIYVTFARIVVDDRRRD